MQMILETKTSLIDARRGKASVHYECHGGGFTLSNILLQSDPNGKVRITLPLMEIGGTKRPVISLQGNIKELIFRLIIAEYEQARSSGEKSLQNRYAYRITEKAEQQANDLPAAEALAKSSA